MITSTGRCGSALLLLPTIFFVASLALRADSTIRYRGDLKLAPFLPLEATEQLKKANSSMSQSMGIKGNLGYSETGGLRHIVDFVKQEMTMVDPVHKRYVTLPVSQFGERMLPNMPDIAEQTRKMFESMKTSFESHKTGRTETIQGVQAEEREAVFSLSMPTHGAEGEPMETMKMVMHIWSAQPSEALRVRAVRELTAYNLWTTHVLNPAQMMQKAFGADTGFAKTYGKMFEDLSNQNALVLRMQMAIYTPMMAQMRHKLEQAGKPLPEGFDPNAPMMEMTMEAEELSTAPIDDALFHVPEDYQQGSLEEMMQLLVKSRTK